MEPSGAHRRSGRTHIGVPSQQRARGRIGRHTNASEAMLASTTLLACALGQCGFAAGILCGGALLMRCSPSRQALCSVGESSLRATSCCVMADGHVDPTLLGAVSARYADHMSCCTFLGRREHHAPSQYEYDLDQPWQGSRWHHPASNTHRAPPTDAQTTESSFSAQASWQVPLLPAARPPYCRRSTSIDGGGGGESARGFVAAPRWRGGRRGGARRVDGGGV